MFNRTYNFTVNSNSTIFVGRGNKTNNLKFLKKSIQLDILNLFSCIEIMVNMVHVILDNVWLDPLMNFKKYFHETLMLHALI